MVTDFEIIYGPEHEAEVLSKEDAFALIGLPDQDAPVDVEAVMQAIVSPVVDAETGEIKEISQTDKEQTLSGRIGNYVLSTRASVRERRRDSKTPFVDREPKSTRQLDRRVRQQRKNLLKAKGSKPVARHWPKHLLPRMVDVEFGRRDSEAIVD